MSARPITIVGGGLAGLTLGIELRRKDIPVTIWESDHYPRHKVCGEFISGRGLEVLRRLGLRDKLLEIGAREAKTVSFFSSEKAFQPKQLTEPALCLSRFQLDALLAEEFRKSGGDLRENSRWTQPFGEGVVRATGRMAKPVVRGWRWFGLKVHARNLSLATDLEMHFTSRGYVGLCRLHNDEVNVCGLFRSETTVPGLSQNWRQWLSGDQNSELGRKLARAVFDDASFCSTAALCIGEYSFNHRQELCLGDSIAMIPPVTGNGMSMAFESAEIATTALCLYAQHGQNWTEARQAVLKQSQTRFQRRLRHAAWLQKMLFCGVIQQFLFCTIARHDRLWRYVFASTR